ncbi:transcription initiation factor IID, 18kD subunit-domain-containing protein [Cantharellus anzutake]|uniref:transcription initiation factor IID, 18kD subunit-domain-containing protein n=1 Tax=Cantharellus anzutake TaxID=1750568 RepID=UPI0019044AE6|nr:transcription initiation factor IID, 18kD subunit-domain-containing protein [Cantharellus anzutake]XP_038913111.1 transcription initiation factor IID, 18kD subunit-domain-containing protein [Cantharellus anzutake]KAF8310056.1 transcription initiation factor IID, 18kD subunit-domain-containing protein [Cantharellus anzutake]KAF8326703.1 transcription initiation factor IID, 18kD subunit-domain-containing protein [Cantharellus anzutake]
MSKAKPFSDEKGHNEYKYTQEISQMMFVFGEVQDPNLVAVNLVEDIVRTQVLEIVIQARLMSAKRGARHISPEDLIFIIRDDKAKVNRLRTYMSWKDVRKNAKEPGGDGKADVDDALDDGADEPSATKTRKRIIKLSWDITTIYSDVFKTLAAANPGRHIGHSDDEDEDEMEAHEDSVKRLRDADEATRNMTKEEYMHYSDCRQASFTYRKTKRFKDFLNLPQQLELRSDDTIDILGFLAFEIVRALTLGALEVKRSLEDAAYTNKRKAPVQGPTSGASPSMRASKRLRADGTELEDNMNEAPWGGAPTPTSSLFLAPPEARTPLTPQHIQDAFTRMQRDQSQIKRAGMRNWRGGLVRTRIGLI